MVSRSEHLLSWYAADLDRQQAENRQWEESIKAIGTGIASEKTDEVLKGVFGLSAIAFAKMNRFITYQLTPELRDL